MRKKCGKVKAEPKELTNEVMLMAKLSFACPFCNVYSTFTQIVSAYGHSICTCDKCRNLVLFIFGKGGEVEDYYPKRIPQTDESIPTEVADDYIESIKCLDVGAFKASVVMSRRAIQSSALKLGIKKGKLRDQVDELHAKKLIPNSVKEWAHEIRLTGNIGAHPDEDLLQDVTKEDAEELVRFVEEYMNYVYVMPARVKAQRTRRLKKKQA